MSTAIKIDNISKQYRLGLVSTKTLSHDLNRWWQTVVLQKEDPYLKIGSENDRSRAADSEYVWALKDISFDVEQGDVVGIIGKNGAGKSTLLKLLSRVTGPTTGTIKAKGRIGSLLEVGTGFHQEMTGRENIFMNGAILGMSKTEIAHKLDEIVDFSGCERYIDTPVKRYSSGMMVRLGFAVAAHLDPEILVVDEVLAVGDAEFQKKAIGKMHDVSQGEGRTVLFVSHNMASVRALCKHGVLLENGKIKMLGKVDDVVDGYLQQDEKEGKGVSILEKVQWHDGRIHLTSIKINGSSAYISNLPSEKRSLEVEIEGYTDEPIRTEVSLLFKNEDECNLASFSYGNTKDALLELSGDFHIAANIELPKKMNCGKLIVDLYFHLPEVAHLLKAPKCCILESEGFRTPYGQVATFRQCGLMELSAL